MTLLFRMGGSLLESGEPIEYIGVCYDDSGLGISGNNTRR
ncbi:MAG: hypothetical protein BAJATHORv1_20030 [Candidatus Thorarchaeota archaeon]|nr:MAG: hypothetical protein BAJATHORv1_20030 [Candidatus Thorarchaeota archaeon]